jgi:hypothetical protein
MGSTRESWPPPGTACSIRNLQHLSEATGGFAAVDTNDVAPAFGRILEESSEFYVVAYETPASAKPGQFRALRVRTSRPGVTIVARKGYLLRRPTAGRIAPGHSTPEPGGIGGGLRNPRRPADAEMAAVPSAQGKPVIEERLLLLLSSPLAKAGLPLRLQAVAFKGAGRKHTVRLLVEILGGALGFTERRGRAEEHIDLALMTVDHHGRASSGRSAAIDLSLPPDDLQRVRATGVRWLSTIDLPLGRDDHARRGGAELRDRTALVSGVTLTSLSAAVMPTKGTAWMDKVLDTPPSAARVFVAGDRITAAVDVYAPAAAQGAVETFAELEGSGALTRVVGEGRGESTVFHVDTGTLKQGAHVLRVVARSGSEEVDRQIHDHVGPDPRHVNGV